MRSKSTRESHERHGAVQPLFTSCHRGLNRSGLAFHVRRPVRPASYQAITKTTINNPPQTRTQMVVMKNMFGTVETTVPRANTVTSFKAWCCRKYSTAPNTEVTIAQTIITDAKAFPRVRRSSLSTKSWPTVTPALARWLEVRMKERKVRSSA